jgi:hypothetical protein
MMLINNSHTINTRLGFLFAFHPIIENDEYLIGVGFKSVKIIKISSLK